MILKKIKRIRFPSLYAYGFILRAATLASKFVFLVYFTKEFSLVDVGQYGVIVAVITLALYISGLDLYAVANREIIKNPVVQNKVITNQLIMFSVGYSIAFPYLVYNLSGHPPKILLLSVLILVFEHVNQELNRVMIALGYIVQSGLNLFLRSGFWVFGFIIFNELNPNNSLEDVFFFWLLGSICALFLLSIKAAKIGIRLTTEFDLAWIKAACVRTIPILVATVSFRGLFTYDRVAVKNSGSDAELAAYVFYFSLTMALFSLFEATAITPNFREIVKNHENVTILRKRVLRLLVLGVLMYALLFLVSLPFVSLVSEFTGKRDLIDLQYLYHLTGLVGLLMVLNAVISHGIYAIEADRINMISVTLAFAFFVLLYNFWPSNVLQVGMIAVFLMSSLGLSFLIKILFFVGKVRL